MQIRPIMLKKPVDYQICAGRLDTFPREGDRQFAQRLVRLLAQCQLGRLEE
jgi:hypothetical protein